METFEDDAIAAVANALHLADTTGRRWGRVIRHTFDLVYNGRETGRYRWNQLMKTEKTHFGSLFEINAQREFDFRGGTKLDFHIAGQEVDAKWSQNFGGWMLPPEVFNEIALVGTADDQLARWSVGLVRVLPEYRRESVNRDNKSGLNADGRSAIHWLWRDAPLPPNVLLALDEAVVEHIFAARGGTERIARLFRAAEGRIVHRTSVETVAQQLDPQKRVRGNGGARDLLAREGIYIFSGAYDAELVDILGGPVPARDEYISLRLVPAPEGVGIPLPSGEWRQLP